MSDTTVKSGSEQVMEGLERHADPEGAGRGRSRRVSVVTGASAGVGRATVRELARRGFDVALVARGLGGLEAAAKEVEAAGGRALVLPTDVASYQEVEEAARRAEDELGEIDLWVNNAMSTAFTPSWEADADEYQRAVEVTFLGQVWGTKAALARMRGRDRGTIVNVGSALSFIGIPLQSAYCASKFACRGFFESVRAELLHEGSAVRLHMVHLPAVNTPQFDWCATSLARHPQPVPPIYRPEVPARAIVSAALGSEPVKIVGSWNTLLVLAGRLFPNLGNRYAARAAWESQMTSEPVSPHRPFNLFRAADEAEDRGAHGPFDRRSGGFWDPSFLRSLPSVGANFVRALRDTVKEKYVGASGARAPAR